VARKKHSSKHSPPVVETLEEIQSMAERMAQWISDNVRLVVGVVVVLLVSAGGIQTYRSHLVSVTNDASNALAKVGDAYFRAMGASAGSREIPELANPASQAGVREDFVKRFAEVAESNAGTVPAALAWLQSGNLLEETGEPEAAIEAWRKGLEAASDHAAVRGMLLIRIASEYEDRGEWKEAGTSHAEAGEIEAFPLRYWAMADAARCFDRAGESARALELIDRVEAGAPSMRLPDHLRERMNELRATSGKTSVSAG